MKRKYCTCDDYNHGKCEILYINYQWNYNPIKTIAINLSRLTWIYLKWKKTRMLTNKNVDENFMFNAACKT